jgi:phage gp36-like protein
MMAALVLFFRNDSFRGNRYLLVLLFGIVVRYCCSVLLFGIESQRDVLSQAPETSFTCQQILQILLVMDSHTHSVPERPKHPIARA